MIAALRSHLSAGRRIYAEGGGAAYLCRQMETPWGEIRRMAGILPAAARRLSEPVPAAPAEVRLAAATWLGPAGTLLRGYRNPSWQFSPSERPHTGGPEETDSYQVLGDFQVIGSPLHLDFAADPCCLKHLFYPERDGLAERYPFAVPSP
jgi:cobyrinic acid a,c-diamide synthase